MPSPRIVDREILDDPDIPLDQAFCAYEQLALVERLIGVTREVLRALSSHRPRPRRVVDIGCGSGHLLRLVRDKLRISVAGVDLRRLPSESSELEIYVLDAAVDPIPKCDVAVCVFVAHHLTGHQLERLIGGVSANADRLLIVDPVRGTIPRMLFQTFLAPWLLPVVAQDGITSLRSAFSVKEFASIAALTRQRYAATVSHRVAILWRYQVLDIRYRVGKEPNSGLS
jgi:SAM-dependent methyltransferase